MSEKINRENLSEEIIRRYYDNRFGKAMSNQIRDDFYIWLADEEDAEKKLMLLEKLGEEELVACQNEKQTDRTKFLRLIEELEKRGSITTESEQEQRVEIKRRRLPLRKVILRVAAVIIPIMIIAGGVMFYNNQQKPITADYTTLYGETRSIELVDGTDIKINAGSHLVSTIDKKQRIVELSGEAFFEVIKDEKRSFVVRTEGLSVTVTGTAFNVLAYPDNEIITVTLNRGSVTVETQDKRQYNLKPDQQFVLDKNSGEAEIISLEAGKAEALAGWKDGTFIAYNASLQEVLNGIKRHYGVEVDITRELKQTNRLTFRFEENTSLSEAMERISIIVPDLKYEIKNNKLVINN